MQEASKERYYQKNKAQADARSIAWAKNNPHKVKASKAKNYKKSWAEWKAILAELKADPCVDCGQSFPPCAMHFDHVRGHKDFEIGRGWRLPLDKVLVEVEKCDLVCANCHAIRTQKGMDGGTHGERVNGENAEEVHPQLSMELE